MVAVSDGLAFDIFVTGRVQGVGYRPFVSRLAHAFNLSGWVRNRSGQVEIRVEGNAEAIDAFKHALVNQAPPLAQPDPPSFFSVPLMGLRGFSIEPSEVSDSSDTHIPPDYFVCDDCLAEMQEPAERRFRYPFINCTQCGPRYTLIDRLPYDRPHTAMSGFALCPSCFAEYTNPLDRRFHAQPLACAECGPALSFFRAGERQQQTHEAALQACVESLREGLIVAVKGVGGYHLLCDAMNPLSIQRLRQHKPRPAKPLAVLVPWRGKDGLALVNDLAYLSEPEMACLRSPQRPIVLVTKQANSQLAAGIAPDLAEVGLMLPYSPLHHLIADAFAQPLIATSANLSGEPVLTDAPDVEARLSHVADAYLHHNRPIRRPADDSVYRLVAGKTRPIRLGRGIAPLEGKRSRAFKQPLLAVGADLKNTVAFGFRDRFVVSPHIGELGSLRSEQVFEQIINDLQRLYDIIPSAIVCDAHPNYYSSRWARSQNLPVIPVFHHHAHASALVGEYDLSGDTLVFTWDGTGYGEDGSIWGGEALLGCPGAWRRVGSLRPFYLPGADKAAREPWRSALAVCWEVGADWQDCPKTEPLLRQVWEQRLNCPKASSVGRLFDAAAALLGLVYDARYEGHAAMRLEAISQPGAKAIELPLVSNDVDCLVIDWQPLLAMLMDAGLSKMDRASIFHASLALALTQQAQLMRSRYGINQIGLSGGVFHNRILTERILYELHNLGFDVFIPEVLPTGDGAISFGQLIDAGWRCAE